MKILVISNVAWDNRNSYGNTLSNWFEGWQDTVFYNIYCRASLPYNSVCENYFTVPPLSLMKNIFRPSRTGWAFKKADIHKSGDDSSEDLIIRHAQQRKKKWMYVVADLAYASGIWKTKSYKSFLKEADPDIVFSFGIADSFFYENYCHIKEYTKAKIVTFVADDMYGMYTYSRANRGKLKARRFKKILAMSDLIYGASEEMCEAYNRIFDIHMRPLYKGCTPASAKINTGNPIRLVYAGNLLWGRDEILAKVADALIKINRDKLRLTLEIYTGSFVPTEMASNLNRGNSSVLCGRRSYEEIVQIMHSADLVMHVESFKESYQRTVRYSFSTKIIDCLQSGSAMMAIGPQGIASIEYSRCIPGVIVVDDLSQLSNILNMIADGKVDLPKRSKQIYDFACKNHSIRVNRQKIMDDFQQLILN